ncbi:glycoside hydrolase family 12 protein [Melanogaster broomeanus]|nr:glycoside hydrolase family 12 protein [Melanogaster broomeanus]
MTAKIMMVHLGREHPRMTVVLVMVFLLVVPLVSGTPLQRRATTVCGLHDIVTADLYSLLTNVWGKAGTSSGSQCSTLDSVNGNTVTWRTNWTWSPGNGVNSFSNIQLNAGINRQLSAISSMPVQTTWDWSQASDGTVVANVAYDLMISDTPGGAYLVETMIWLANFNAGPVSSVYSSSGQPVPIESDLSIAGDTWNLYSGSNGANQVYSFLLTSGIITSFSADVYPFLSHLVETHGLDSSQYLTAAQAGTEVTSGTATLTTSAYSLTVN